MTNLLALREGTQLVGDYRIKRVLGAGGFGITYLAEEISLAREVTIKEYFPADFAARDGASQAVPRSQQCEGDYQWGLDRFIEEGPTLAKFNHPNIVRVYRYFVANNTAYIVLHFEEGTSFKGWLKGLGRAPRQAELDAILAPLLDALELIHAADFLHRDIAPDNIIIRKDGSPVLIDFGAARGDIAEHSRTVSALVKPGYSPYEQYATSSRTQGPWTDIYSLGATLYQAVTGKRPDDSPNRMVSNDLQPARELALSSYRPRFLSAIDKALALEIKERPQSVKAWRADLRVVEPKPARRKAAEAPAAAPTTVKVEPVERPQPQAAPPPPRPTPSPSRANDISRPPSGGILREFMAGFRRGDAAVAEAVPARIVAAVTAPPRPAPPKPKPTPAKPAPAAPTVVAAPTVAVPPPAAAPAVKPRRSLPRALVRLPTPERNAPRPARTPFFTKRRLGSLGAKLLIGIGVASAAVTLQERWPRVESRGAGTLSSDRTAPLTTSSTKPAATTVATSTPPASAPALSPAASALPPRETALIGQIPAHRGTIAGLAYLDDAEQIVTTGADATIKLWTLSSGGLVRTIELDDGPASAMSVRGRRAITVHQNGTAAVWDLERGEKIAALKRGPAETLAATFLTATDRVAVGDRDGTVTFWDLKNSSAPVQMFEGHEGPVQAIAVTSSGEMVASGGADRVIRLWDAVALSHARTYRGHQTGVTALAFSGDGRMLASAAVDGRIRIWLTQSSRTYRTLRGHQARVSAVAFAPSAGSPLLASASQDGTVRVWDVRRWRTVKTFTPHAGEVRSLSFSPDGRRLASAGTDGVVRIWDMTASVSRE
jgi:WD40 repeat protein/serine/threonine protein kinase